MHRRRGGIYGTPQKSRRGGHACTPRARRYRGESLSAANRSRARARVVLSSHAQRPADRLRNPRGDFLREKLAVPKQKQRTDRSEINLEARERERESLRISLSNSSCRDNKLIMISNVAGRGVKLPSEIYQ